MSTKDKRRRMTPAERRAEDLKLMEAFQIRAVLTRRTPASAAPPMSRPQLAPAPRSVSSPPPSRTPMPVPGWSGASVEAKAKSSALATASALSPVEHPLLPTSAVAAPVPSTVAEPVPFATASAAPSLVPSPTLALARTESQPDVAPVEPTAAVAERADAVVLEWAARFSNCQAVPLGPSLAGSVAGGWAAQFAFSEDGEAGAARGVPTAPSGGAWWLFAHATCSDGGTLLSFAAPEPLSLDAQAPLPGAWPAAAHDSEGHEDSDCQGTELRWTRESDTQHGPLLVPSCTRHDGTRLVMPLTVLVLFAT